MNKELKVAIIKKFGTAYEAAKVIEINPASLSHMIQGHRGPTEFERERLKKIFSGYQLRKFFPRPKPMEKVEGENVVNE